jgi:hypothetical protein
LHLGTARSLANPTWAARALCLALAGCVATSCSPELPTPLIDSVVPDRGYNGEVTLLSVSGENFLPLVSMDPNDEEALLDHEFRLWLEQGGQRTNLEAVQFVSYDELRAYVPEGLAKGLYDVGLDSPDGQEASSRGAFTVTDTRADHLAFDVDTVAWVVHEPIPVAFELQDPKDEGVQQSLDVVLSVTSLLGAEGVTPFPVQFSGAVLEPIENGFSMTGSLSPAGDGLVTLETTIEDDLTISLEPVEPDSIVEGDSQVLSISPGSLVGVHVGLPSKGFSTVAGRRFPLTLTLVDGWGNVLHDAEATLVLNQHCGGNLATLTIVGQWSGEVALTRATGTTECPENWVEVLGTTAGSSDPIEVLPAAADHFDVSAYPDTVTVGLDELYSIVSARDPYENAVTDYAGTLVLALDQALSETDGGLLFQVCTDFGGGSAFCTTRPWKAGSGVKIVATGTGDVTGSSGDLTLLPGAVSNLSISLGPSPYEAGTMFGVELSPLDAFGNFVDISALGPEVLISGSESEPSCFLFSTPGPGRGWLWDCTLFETAASESVVVLMRWDGGSVTARSSEFMVRNGPLAQVEWSFASPGPYVAGDAFEVHLEAFDAWGNPWTHKRDPVGDPPLDISDQTGTLSTTPTTVRLDEGVSTAMMQATVTDAGTDTLTVRHSGTTVSTSPVFNVIAGPASELDVVPERPWAFLGEPRQITVTVVDDFGNSVNTYSGTVVVDSIQGTTTGGSSSDFSGGSVTLDLDFARAALNETLYASVVDAVLEGSASIDVLDPSCDANLDGSTDVAAAFDIDGSSGDARVCWNDDGADAKIDASASTGDVSGYHFWDGQGLDEDTPDAAIYVHWEDPGVTDVEVVAYTSSACGSLAEGTAWIVPNDGQAAGPIDLSAEDSVLHVGSVVYSATVVHVTGAVDCSGDAAAGATIYVRSSLGAFTGGVAPTGTGLAMVLDDHGAGSAEFSVADETHGGTVDIYAGSLDGLAFGSTSLTASGDAASPHVIDLEPRGSSADTIESVSVWFDDAMKTTRAQEYVSLTDSRGVAIPTTALTFSDGDTVLTLDLAEPLDLSDTTATFRASSSLRDTSGNRLDGSWTGTGSEFEAEFGLVSSEAPSIMSCTADVDTFRPDGDDETGTVEADEVRISATADDPPAWWVLEVYDATTGALESTAWQPGDGSASCVFEWTGRDQDGSVVGNADYTLSIFTLDEHLNPSDTCDVGVVVDNLLVERP